MWEIEAIRKFIPVYSKQAVVKAEFRANFLKNRFKILHHIRTQTLLIYPSKRAWLFILTNLNPLYSVWLKLTKYFLRRSEKKCKRFTDKLTDRQIVIGIQGYNEYIFLTVDCPSVTWGSSSNPSSFSTQ